MIDQGRGFNTGVILLDLARLRLIDWVHMWKSVAFRVLNDRQFTVLADQVCLSLSIYLSICLSFCLCLLLVVSLSANFFYYLLSVAYQQFFADFSVVCTELLLSPKSLFFGFVSMQDNSKSVEIILDALVMN